MAVFHTNASHIELTVMHTEQYLAQDKQDAQTDHFLPPSAVDSSRPCDCPLWTQAFSPCRVPAGMVPGGQLGTASHLNICILTHCQKFPPGMDLRCLPNVFIRIFSSTRKSQERPAHCLSSRTCRSGGPMIIVPTGIPFVSLYVYVFDCVMCVTALYRCERQDSFSLQDSSVESGQGVVLGVCLSQSSVKGENITLVSLLIQASCQRVPYRSLVWGHLIESELIFKDRNLDEG